MPQGSQKQMSPEEVAKLKEKIKNMSPEELREFQKKQCIFCHIVAGKMQAKKVFEDDKCLGILDINPAAPGHVLLLPKEHYSIMPQVPSDVLTHIFMVAKSLSNTVLRSLDAKGTNIIIANGPAAGQQAQHFMLHIIPRKEKDGIEFTLPQNKNDEKELEEIRKKIAEKMGFKKPKKEKVVVDESKVLKKPELDFAAGTEEEPQEEQQKEQRPEKQEKNKPQKQLKPKAGKNKKEEGVSLDDIADLLGEK